MHVFNMYIINKNILITSESNCGTLHCKFNSSSIKALNVPQSKKYIFIIFPFLERTLFECRYEAREKLEVT